MRLRRMWAAAACVVVGMGGAVLGLAAPSGAVQQAHDRIVSDDPVNNTPHVLDGEVRAIVRIGGRVFVGGEFTQVQAAGSGTVLTRNNLFAYDASTGAVDTAFAPDMSAMVSALVPAPDGQSIYVGGRFGFVNGVRDFVLTRLNVDTGLKVPGFTPQFDARVLDLKLAGGRLYVAGAFAGVEGVARPALAAVDPATGARDDFVDLGFAGVQDGGTTSVLKMDITPDGGKLIAIGNFNAVAGQTRNQIAMIDLTGPQAALSSWNTTGFAGPCASVFDTYMRDIDISPDGAYFVVTTTGAYRSPPSLCDSHSRWETGATGPGQNPTWVNYTGGDTTYAVALTGTAVYVGGHFRWVNNPFRADAAGQGAVSREGIAALDPANGLPFSWNPGRALGVGVFDMLANADGLYVGSDTELLAGEVHRRLGRFPLTGGEQIDTYDTGTLPGNVYLGGSTATFLPSNFLRHRSFDGTTAGTVVNDSTLGLDWRNVRGAFMINGTLYHGLSDGSLVKRPFDGASLGPAEPVDTADELVFMSDWHGSNGVRNIRGMFFSNGRIYYTRGTSQLFYRGFNPESDVVGAQEITATGNLSDISWGGVRGMFLAGNKLYWVNDSNGRLFRSDFVNGLPVAGTAVQVSADDWRARALFIFSGIPNDPPVASFTANCTGLSCDFNSAGSADPDGTIAGRGWDFGDGGTATGTAVSHTYAAPGTYTVQLTVTDDRGGTDTEEQQVTVAEDQVAIDFLGTDGSNANTTAATVTVPGSVEPGDGLILALTYNSTTITGGAPTGVTGWTEIGRQEAGSSTSVLWKKVAGPGDAGQPVSVAFSDFAKADLRVLAYAGTDATDPVAAVAGAVDPATVTAHTTPSAAVSAPGSWAVSYWADKSSATTTWTPPGAVSVRGTLIGSGSGRVTSLVADSGGTVATGGYGELTASTDAASRALMWTIVLAPGG